MSETINEVTLALELLVTFAGVFLAFMLDRLIDYRKEQRIKHVLLRNLGYELNRLKEALSGEAKRLDHDVYDSAIASGRLNFLASEQLMKITDVYTKIKNADIRAMSVIIAKETFDRSKSEHTQEGYSSLKNAYNITKQEASKSIDEILKEPWLSRYAQKS
jgi:hypothetical protein